MDDHRFPELGDHYDRLVESLVAAGEFESPDEVMREALRLLERNQQALETLRQAIRAGEDSGDPEPFDLDQFLEEMHRRPSRAG